MKYFEFGTEHPELMVILHGGGVSYLGALPAAKEMAKVYHMVLAAYDGFNPDEPETEFQSPADEARRLGDYLTAHYGGKVDILYAISYGCRVMMEVLADPRLTITTTIADGMGLKDYPNIRSKWGKDLYCFFFTGIFYAVMGRPGPGGKSSWLRSAAGLWRKPSASSTAGPPGKAGRIRITSSSAGKRTTPSLKRPTCSSGTASRGPWTKSSPPVWTP